MLFLGQHTKSNKEKAIKLYEMAVKLNYSNALTNYGYFLLTGDGVPKDKDKAFFILIFIIHLLGGIPPNKEDEFL